MKQFRIHKDDKVMVIAGKDEGKIGKVLKVLRKSDRVLVEKVNVAKRHVRPNPYKREPGTPRTGRKSASARSATKPCRR